MKLSRRELVAYLMEHKTERDVMRVAAYLIENGRSREFGAILRDTEEQLMQSGRAVAHVRSARKLDTDEQRNIIAKLKQQDESIESVEIINTIDPSLVGGAVVRTPRMEVDVSIRGRLERMRRG